MGKIEIKNFYGGWNEVDAEKAKEFCLNKMRHMPNVSSGKDRMAIINEKHLRGITYEELVKGSISRTAPCRRGMAAHE